MGDARAVPNGTSAIIGHTGLVGSDLVRQATFDDCYNSANIREIAGRHYDLLVCSGARGTKWIANREPDRDMADIRLLLDNVTKVRAEFVILISTVDVFGVPVGLDEDAPIESTAQTSYGRHRQYVEQTLSAHFPRLLIIRLPGLYGRGLRKNALYDLLSDHEVEKIHPRSTYQFYWLEHVWRDVQLAVSAGLSVVHFATAPVSIGDVAKEVFGRDLPHASPNTAPATYDFRTKYADVFGGADGYMKDRSVVMHELRTFVSQYRGDASLVYQP